MPKTLNTTTSDSSLEANIAGLQCLGHGDVDTETFRSTKMGLTGTPKWEPRFGKTQPAACHQACPESEPGKGQDLRLPGILPEHGC